MRMLPCHAPGCIRRQTTSIGLCMPCTVEQVASGRPPTVHAGIQSPGVVPERVALLQDAERLQPGWLLTHVQRMFDQRLGPLPQTDADRIFGHDREAG